MLKKTLTQKACFGTFEARGQCWHAGLGVVAWFQARANQQRAGVLGGG